MVVFAPGYINLLKTFVPEADGAGGSCSADGGGGAESDGGFIVTVPQNLNSKIRARTANARKADPPIKNNPLYDFGCPSVCVCLPATLDVKFASWLTIGPPAH
jgi:hypothetical protein